MSYSLDGVEIYEIGGIDSDALFNKEGKLISSFNISHFEPRFYSAWYEIENNRFIQKSKDILEDLGKSYKFNGGDVFFVAMDKMPVVFSPTWDNVQSMKLTVLKVLDSKSNKFRNEMEAI